MSKHPGYTGYWRWQKDNSVNIKKQQLMSQIKPIVIVSLKESDINWIAHHVLFLAYVYYYVNTHKKTLHACGSWSVRSGLGWSFLFEKCWKEILVPFQKDGWWFVVPGSCGNISDGSSRSSRDGIDDRIPPTLSRADFPQSTTVTHACHNLNLKPNGQLVSSSSEDLLVGSSHSTPSRTLGAKPNNRNEARPPPPPYRHSRSTPSVVSSGSVVSQSQQHPQQLGKAGNQNSSSPAGTLMPTSSEWQDWQRDRWHIWQLLSSDSADTLPETLVWCQANQFSVFIYRSHCLMCVMYRKVVGLSSIVILYRQLE